MIPPELRHALNLHAARGGKQWRRREVRRVEAFVRWCGCDPRQIGKGHVRRYFETKVTGSTTQRDHWYAICLLWRILGRPGRPPKPPSPDKS
jgi:hypothetical protein